MIENFRPMKCKTNQYSQMNIKQRDSWVRTNFRKEDTMKVLFSDEKLFDVEGIYNSQNDRIWAISCSEAYIKDGIRQICKFLQKIMISLGARSKGLPPLVIFENGAVDHNCYINEVLPVALKYWNSIFGNHWIFQQDGAKTHFHEKTQEWCANDFLCSFRAISGLQTVLI